MRSISALAVILASVLLLSAVELECDTPPATLGAPPLTITQLGKIEIPGESKQITLMLHHGNRFYVGAESEEGGLHCYSLPNYEHLWTVSLGTFSDSDSSHRVTQEMPRSMVFSEDGLTAFIVVGNDFPHELVKFDVLEAKVLSQTNLSEYGYIEPVILADTPVLVHQGAWHLRVYDQLNLSNLLLEIDETLLHPSADSIPYKSDACFSTLVVDELHDRLYSTTDFGDLLRFDFSKSPDGLSFESVSTPINVKPWMSTWIGGELAVIDHDSGELSFYDPDTLEKTGVMQSLQYARFMENIESVLYITNNISDSDETTDGESFHFNARLQVIDPNNGEVFFQLFPDSSIEEIHKLDDGYMTLVSEGSLAFLEDSDSEDRFPTWTSAHGAIWLLDTETMEFIGEAQYPEGCAMASFNGDSGEFVMAQYNHTDLDGPYIQDELRIMRIELPQD